MSFKHDWNTEVIAQFQATFFYDVDEDAIHWMTEGVHYKVNFTILADCLALVIRIEGQTSFTMKGTRRLTCGCLS
jgi:hypothetical protein